MNKVGINVEITLSDEITDPEQIAVITENVMKGIVSQVNNSEEGIVGIDFDGYTSELMVSSASLTKVWNCHNGKITTL